MKKILHRSLASTIALLLFLSLFLSSAVNRAAEADDLTGKEAPSFNLKDTSGKEVSLSSFMGKPVLLNFWATWCPYCRKERTHLNALNEAYKDKGLVIISVATDKSDKTVKGFLERNPASFIVLTDSDGKAARSYNVEGLPTTYLIDQKGIVKQKIIGFREWGSTESRKLIDTYISN